MIFSLKFIPDRSNKFVKRPFGITEGIFLIFLTLIGNFLISTLNCDLLYILRNNLYVKQLLILFIIYFSINYSSNYVQNPSYIFLVTIEIWIIYILLMSMLVEFTIAIIILLCIVYILNNYGDYYQQLFLDLDQKKKSQNSKIYQELILSYDKCRDIILYSILVIMLIGTITSFYKMYKNNKNFNIFTHFFKIMKCEYV